MKYKFKPLKNVHLNFLRMFLVIMLPAEIGLIQINNEVFDLPLFVASLTITIVVIATYFAFRLFYPCVYVVSQGYVTKYKGKNVLFRIKIADIKKLIIKKANFFDYYKYAFSSMINSGFTTTAYLTTVSFVYDNCETFVEQKNLEIERLPLTENGENKEYIEIMSYRQAKKLAKIIGANLQIKKGKR